MILVILTALTAVCGAAKLDQNYLPPITAKTAGGSAGELQAPFDGSNQGFGGLPTGSYTNDVQGVVVDAVNPGTRTSGAEPTGLGGPRTTYGSLDSKVGDAAFRGSLTGLGNSGGPNTRIAPGFGSFVESDESQTDKTRGSNLKFTSDVTLDNYSYGYNTDNGISVGENGVAANGVQAEGGYSYKGDDGKTYSVTYTADEGGYKPQGHHLPTPPPIPDEIIKSLEKNAKEEAAGHVDDGSYDASKYNEEGDYSSNGAGNNNARPTIGGGDATASGSFESHTNQAHRPSSGVLIGSYNSDSFDIHSSQVHAAQGFGDISDNKQSGFGLNKEHRGSQGVGVSGDSSSIGGRFGQSGLATSQVGNNYVNHGQFGANSQFSSQGAQTHSTENRYGVQAIKPVGTDASAFSGLHSQGHTQGSLSSSPVRTQSFGLPGHSNVNSAYSSAVTTGSGSASAFASTGPSDSGLRNEYNLPLNSFGSAGQYTHNSKSGSDSSAGASFLTPSTASASASASGTPTFGTHSQQYSGTHQQSGSQQYSGSHNALPSAIPQYSTSFPIVQGTTAAPPFSSTGTPSFGTVNSNKAPPPSHSNSGSYSQSGHSSEAGVVGEYLPPVNTVDYTGQVSHSSNVQGAHSPTAASTPYYHTHGQSSNLPSSASSSASVTGNQQSFGQSNQQFNSFNTDSNNFPSRFGESQQSGNSVENSGYLPPVNIIESTNRPTYHSKPQGFDSSSAHTHSSEISSSGSAKPTSGSSGFGVSSQQTGFQSQSFNSKPGQYTQNKNVIPLSSGQNQFGSTNTQFSGVQPTQPTVGFEGFSSQGPTNVPSTTPAAFSHQTSHNQHIPSTTPATSFSSSQETSQSGSAFQSQSKFPSQLASGQYKPTDATYASSTQQPALGQQQGFDASYYYSHPSKPFITPSTAPNSQFSNNGQPNFPTSSSSQQGSKYPNTPTTPTTGQYQNPSSSSYNGITQAAISPFPSGSPLTSTQSSQFGSKPTQSSQFGQSVSSQQTSTQFGATGTQQTFSPEPVALFGQKPIVQSQTQFGQSSTSQTSEGSQPTQQYQGTIYQYNKPAVSLPAPDHKDTSSNFGLVTSSQTDSQAKPSQISTDSRFGSQQGSSQFGSQSFGNNPTYGSTFQQTQTAQGSTFGSQSNSQFGQKHQTSQGTVSTSAVSQGQSVQTSQFGQKPSVSSQTTGSNYQQSQFNQKPQTSQGSIFSSNTNTQSQQSQFGKKPTSSTPSGSYYQQTTPSIGLSASPVTQSPTSFGQKPFGSSQATGLQQTQFGTSGSQFGQKPQNTEVSSGTSNSYSQSQTSQFGKKPFGTTQTGSAFQETQFGSHFNQNSQSTQGTSGLTSTAGQTTFGQKPSQTGSSYQQTQFGSTGSQFGQKEQSTIQGSSITSSTGSKDQSVQTSQFGVGSSQNTQIGTATSSQFGKKPFGTTQTGSTFQQTQFGSQFNQNSQSTQGTSGLTSTSGQTTFGQKPSGTAQTGSSYQQSQFGSTGSQFGQKPQSTIQGSPIILNTGSKEQSVQTSQFGFGSSQNTQSSTGTGSQFGKKPFGTTQTGSTFQQTQFGSQFNQNSQSSQGTSGLSAGVAPNSQFAQTSQSGQKLSGSSSGASSSFQQSQFASSAGSQFSQTPQTAQGTISQVQPVKTTQFGIKPFGSSQSSQGSTTQQTQFGSTVSRFGQTSQSSQVPTLTTISQTVQPTYFGQKPFGASQNTGSSVQKNQFGTSGSVFGQKPQTVQTTQSPISSFGSYSQSSQFGTQPKKPYGSTQTPFQTQFGSTTGQFGQKPQVQANAFASNSGSNVASFGSTQTGQTSQFGSQTQGATSFGSQAQKPVGSSLSQTNYQQSQYSQTSGKYGSQSSQSNVGNGQIAGQTSFSAVTQKPFGSQTTQTPYQQTQFNQGQKPFGTSQNTGSTVQKNQFGTSGSVFGQKPLIAQTTQAPVSSFGSYSQSSQFGTETKKPYGSTQTPFQTQFGSTNGQFGQKPQVQANAFASSSGSNLGSFGSSQTGQTSQFGSQTQGATSFGSQVQKPVGSSLSQTNYQQSQYSQTSGKYGSQTSQSNVGSGQVAGQTSFSAVTQKPFGSQTTQTPYQQTQFNQGQKPFGTSQNTGSSVQKNQFGTSGSVFGQKPLTVQTTQSPISSFGSYSQSSQFGTQTKKPYGSTEKPLQAQFGSTTGQFVQKPQVQVNAFASSSGSNVGSFGSSQTDQISQFGSQTQGSESQKPVGSSLSQNNYQQSQYTQTSGTYGSQSQFGQTSQSNVGSGQVAAIRPYGSSSTQGTFQQSQSNTGSTQFGTQPTKATDFIAPLSQTSRPQFSGQAFKPASTTSTQGSGFQSQSSAVSSSQFGVQPTKPTGLTHFSGQPFKPASTQGSNFGTQSLVGSTPQFGVQPTQGAIITTQKPSQTQFSGEPFKQSVFSSTQAPSFPNRLSSNLNAKPDSYVVSTVQTPEIVSVPGYEINSSQTNYLGQKEEFGGPRDPPRFDDKTGYHY